MSIVVVDEDEKHVILYEWMNEGRQFKTFDKKTNLDGVLGLRTKITSGLPNVFIYSIASLRTCLYGVMPFWH